MFSDPRSLALIAYEHKPSVFSALSPSVCAPPEHRENFKVVIRLRPPLPREVSFGRNFSSIATVSSDHRAISLQEYLGSAETDQQRERDIVSDPSLCNYHHFTFDHIYDMNDSQQELYENTAKPAVLSVLEGYNATILAYGQTGTGKTYTMEGFKYNSTDPQRGICPRAAEEIFKHIQCGASTHTTFMVRASYLQIYNENISDLLKADRFSLQIREDRKRGMYVDGLSEWAVRSPSDIFSLIQRGQGTRHTASTKMNDLSSRSHAVFIVHIEQMFTNKAVKLGKLNFVDLAGSERVRVSGATGIRLEESKKINQSLSALGNVISALTDLKQRTHIPYRDSKLTRLLEDSLGGNCRTTMVANITPAHESFGETLSTLKFANRAKHIKNSPKVNEDLDEKGLLRKYEMELQRLRSELEAKDRSMVDMKKLLALEEDKKQAEADREAMMEALEKRSEEYLLILEEKRKLEQKVKIINSQVLAGGEFIEETPQFITALETKQKLIRSEYEAKLTEIERERERIEEEKAEMDSYKQLLLEQRDIMTALTARLNERDETIIQLYEELDAYDQVHREIEGKLDAKEEKLPSTSDSPLTQDDKISELYSVIATLQEELSAYKNNSDSAAEQVETSPPRTRFYGRKAMSVDEMLQLRNSKR